MQLHGIESAVHHLHCNTKLHIILGLAALHTRNQRRRQRGTHLGHGGAVHGGAGGDEDAAAAGRRHGVGARATPPSHLLRRPSEPATAVAARAAVESVYQMRYGTAPLRSFLLRACGSWKPAGQPDALHKVEWRICMKAGGATALRPPQARCAGWVVAIRSMKI